MRTYTNLDRDVLDVSRLSPQEAAFLDRMLTAYRAGMSWHDFANLVSGPENPALEPGARITAAVQANVLYRAVRDLEDRLGIRQGKLRSSPGDDVESDPLADEFVTVAEAARLRDVSVRAIYSAIERGEIVSPQGERPARVSARSLGRWHPNEVRQAAGRARVIGLMEALEETIAAAKQSDAKRASRKAANDIRTGRQAG